MIGVFDSGLGGLTVLEAIRRYAPKADIVYFGDTKNAPYGNKTKEEVKKLTILGIQKLLDVGATEIVSACNSVSISLDPSMLSVLSLSPEDIIEMIGPTVRDLKDRPEKNIRICATLLTIDSGVYQARLSDIGKSVTEMPLPELVSYIEAGKEVAPLLKKYFAGIDTAKEDLILLGCTHFPLVEESFREVCSVHTYNPASAVAREVASQFSCEGSGSTTYLFSKETPQTREYTKRTP